MDYTKLTKIELQLKAKELNKKGYSNLNKPELIDLLNICTKMIYPILQKNT